MSSPKCAAVDVQVEGPAIGDVARYGAEGRGGDRDVELPDEGRDIDEAHVRGVRAVPLDERLDESAGRVDADAGLGRRALDPPEFHGGSGQADDAVAAVRAVVGVLHEDDAEVGVRHCSGSVTNPPYMSA